MTIQDSGESTNNTESLKFHIEKTHASLFEIGRRTNKATIMFFVFLTTALLITFATPKNEDVFFVPLIKLSLPRWIAAELATSLASLFLLLNAVLCYYAVLHSHHLSNLLKKAQQGTVMWTLYYPTVPSLIGILTLTDKFKGKNWVLFQLLYSTCMLSFPIFTIICIGYKSTWSGIFLYLSMLVTFLSLALQIIIFRWIYSGDEVKKTVKELSDLDW